MNIMITQHNTTQHNRAKFKLAAAEILLEVVDKEHNTTQHNTTQHADYVGQRLFVKQFNPFLSVFYMLKNGFFILNGGDCCD